MLLYLSKHKHQNDIDGQILLTLYSLMSQNLVPPARGMLPFIIKHPLHIIHTPFTPSQSILQANHQLQRQAVQLRPGEQGSQPSPSALLVCTTQAGISTKWYGLR